MADEHRSPVTPAVVLIVGFGFSLAANLLWTWPGGYVRVLGGVFASVALPAAVHMWPLVPATRSGHRWLRNAVMGAIAVLAAVTTFSHASSLLIAHGEDAWLARAYPVMTELLVVFAVLARRSPTTARRAKVPPPRPAKPRAPRPAASSTAPAAVPPNEVRAHADQRAERIEWLRGREDLVTWTEKVKAIEERFHVSRATAKRDVDAVANEAAS